MRVIMLGAPGTGKGTQASLLATELGVAHISTGDMLREAVAQRTPLGKEVEGVMAEGKLVPDALMVRVVEERLAADDCARGFILDGFPRTVAQAEALDRLLGAKGKTVDLVVLLEVPEAEIVRRLSSRRLCATCGTVYNLLSDEPARTGVCPKCGGALVQRADDNEETVRERLRVYARQTEPVRKYYEKQGKLCAIQGDRSIAEVHRAILEAVQRAGMSTTSR
ncbi:MAG: adenylate kinase [candidate division KSB1 bacterium]|nr:adenylate kinase [candidate division KSB1 bacterium]